MGINFLPDYRLKKFLRQKWKDEYLFASALLLRTLAQAQWKDYNVHNNFGFAETKNLFLPPLNFYACFFFWWSLILLRDSSACIGLGCPTTRERKNSGDAMYKLKRVLSAVKQVGKNCIFTDYSRFTLSNKVSLISHRNFCNCWTPLSDLKKEGTLRRTV